MKKYNKIEGSYDFFSGEKIDNVLVLRFKENLMLYTTELKAKITIINYLDRVSRDDTIKVILLLFSPHMKGSDEYIKFYNQVLQSKLDTNAALKMLHAVDEFILKLRELSQLVIHTHSGKVLPMFLNVSLACDYRIAADNTIFQNPSLRYGLAPKGGGAFFLYKMLGISKAFEILLSEKDMAANEALRLGLIDKVVPLSELQGEALKIAENYARKPTSSLRIIKRLLNFNLKDLREYLSYETQEIGDFIRLSISGAKPAKVI
ncbi:MAG: enoyl-CoA hydratase/isomerase family protein [Desulfobacterales bacterium]|jgi:enoyl-CoA hydratase/carnithine racemase